MVDIYIVYLFILPKFKFLGDFVLGIIYTQHIVFRIFGPLSVDSNLKVSIFSVW